MLSIVKGRHVGSAGPYAVDAFPPTVADAATARDAGILALSVQLASLIAGAARRWRWRAGERVLLVAVASGGMRRHSACALDGLDVRRHWAPQARLVRCGVPVHRSALGIRDAPCQALCHRTRLAATDQDQRRPLVACPARTLPDRDHAHAAIVAGAGCGSRSAWHGAQKESKRQHRWLSLHGWQRRRRNRIFCGSSYHPGSYNI